MTAPDLQTGTQSRMQYRGAVPVPVPVPALQRCAARLAFGLALAIGPAAGAPQVELPELLADSANAASVLEAEAETESARDEVARERAAGGLRVTLGGGYGLVRNIVDTNRAFTYAQAQAEAGFSLPLLGSAEKTHRNVDVALGRQGESSARAANARRLAAIEIERDYAAYWGAQESLRVIDAYLATEDRLVPKLRMRAQSRMMLQSDLLDAQSAYEQARDDRWRMQRIEQAAVSRIHLLTGRDLDDFEAVAVDLPQIDTVDVDRVVDRHPELAVLHAQEDSLQRQRSHSFWYGIDASVDVVGTGVKDMSQGGPNGGTALAALNVTMPISLFSVRSAERRRLQAEIDAAHQRYWERSQELVGEVKAALLLQQQAGQQESAAASRQQAAQEALREGTLRGDVFAQEGVEVLSRRLRTYYSMALERLDARVKSWQANADLRGYANIGAADTAPLPQSDHSAALGAELAAPLAGLLPQAVPPPPPPPPPPAAPPPAAPPEPAAPSPPATINGFPIKPAPAAPPPAPSTAPVPPADPAGTGGPATIHGFPIKPAPVPPARPGAAPAAFRPAAAAGRLLPAVLRAPAGAGPIRPRESSMWPAGYAGGGPAASGRIAADPAPDLAVYVWNSDDVLVRSRDSAGFWPDLARMHIGRLLLALDARQIEQARGQAADLAGFLADAQSHGVAVELLLGDPHWIEPDQRGKLVAIVQSLRGFAFAGLDLDIEPDQLFAQPLRRSDFEAWAQTLTAAARAAPWPVSVSVHPRYFRDAPYAQWNLAQRLRDGGVRQATLMVYSSNPQRVADIVVPIAAAAPELRFRVAQSVEPGLEPQSSYAAAGPGRFEQSMQRLQALLAARPNVDGVVVQGWADLIRMGYESQVR